MTVLAKNKARKLALTIVAFPTYFLFAYPSLISLFLFFAIVPVFLILGLGLFRNARNQS